MRQVFELQRDHHFSGDPERDAFHIPFPDDDKFQFRMGGVSPFDLPEVIYFQANFNLIPKYDYPLTDLIVPVMSKKMLSTIRANGNFACRSVPIIMIDDTYLDNPFDARGTLKDEVRINADYMAIQFTSFTDAFDKQQSVYLPLRGRPEKVGVIDHLVLKGPEGGFPPIFKIPEMPRTLFITEAVKNAMVYGRIRGCKYREVLVSCA